MTRPRRKANTPRKLRNLFVLVACSLFLAVRPADAQGWNTGIGGNSRRSGFVPVRGPLRGQIRWQKTYADGALGQPVTDGDRVFTADCASSCYSPASWLTLLIANTRIVARQVQSGYLLWTANVPIASDTDGYPSILGAGGGMVYVTRADNYLQFPGCIYALHESDGSLAWASQDKFWLTATDSIAFAPNWDLLLGEAGGATRIRALDGVTVARAANPTSGPAYCLAVRGSVAYGFFRGSLEALDVETGAILYSGSVPGRSVTALMPPFLGPNGMVFVATQPSLGDLLEPGELDAFGDTGTGLTLLWHAPLPAGLIHATFAVGADGSVYSYSTDHRILRLDGETGVVLAESQVLPWDAKSGFNGPRMALDAFGDLYVTTISTDSRVAAGVFAFDRELELQWEDLNIHLQDMTGPALSADGTLLVPGPPSHPATGLETGNVGLRAYAPGPQRIPAKAVGVPPPVPVTGRGGH